MSLSRLEKIIGSIAITATAAVIPFIRNSTPHTTAERALGVRDALINNPFITPYISDFADTFTYSLASGLVGDYIQRQGEQRGNRLLTKVGTYFPEILTTVVTSYFVLGETILPSILSGTADGKDVPAAIMGAIAGYTLAKLGRKTGINQRIYDIIKQVAIKE